jgi:hypothetical protein
MMAERFALYCYGFQKQVFHGGRVQYHFLALGTRGYRDFGVAETLSPKESHDIAHYPSTSLVVSCPIYGISRKFAFIFSSVPMGLPYIRENR